jgi:glycosyltransferase involved in cell wall biosynthesis
MISIIIPTYNRAHLIARAIESVQNQHFKKWELIIVDDGSTDDTEPLVRSFQTDDRIKYLLKKNSGAADSRNVGVAKCSYEWITFLDSDDEAKPEWLATFVEEILHGGAIISCGLEKYDESGNLLSTTLPAQNKKNTGGQFTNGGVYIMPKKIFLELGGFDPMVRAGQHSELYFRIREYCLINKLSTTIIPVALIKIHVHKGLRIRSDHKAKFEGSYYTYKKHFSGALKSKKKRSLFEGIIAYNAFRLGNQRTAISFQWKSFKNQPSFKAVKKLFRYLLRVK